MTMTIKPLWCNPPDMPWSQTALAAMLRVADCQRLIYREPAAAREQGRVNRVPQPIAMQFLRLGDAALLGGDFHSVRVACVVVEQLHGFLYCTAVVHPHEGEQVKVRG